MKKVILLGLLLLSGCETSGTAYSWQSGGAWTSASAPQPAFLAPPQMDNVLLCSAQNQQHDIAFEREIAARRLNCYETLSLYYQQQRAIAAQQSAAAQQQQALFGYPPIPPPDRPRHGHDRDRHDGRPARTHYDSYYPNQVDCTTY